MCIAIIHSRLHTSQLIYCKKKIDGQHCSHVENIADIQNIAQNEANIAEISGKLLLMANNIDRKNLMNVYSSYL